jgi:hypothetical protein
MSTIVNSLASATAGDMLPAFKPDKELVMMQVRHEGRQGGRDGWRESTWLNYYGEAR